MNTKVVRHEIMLLLTNFENHSRIEPKNMNLLIQRIWLTSLKNTALEGVVSHILLVYTFISKIRDM